MVFQGFNCVALLKTLCSRVLVSFAGHRRLHRSLASFRWIRETVKASFNSKGMYG